MGSLPQVRVVPSLIAPFPFSRSAAFTSVSLACGPRSHLGIHAAGRGAGRGSLVKFLERRAGRSNADGGKDDDRGDEEEQSLEKSTLENEDVTGDLREPQHPWERFWRRRTQSEIKDIGGVERNENVVQMQPDDEESAMESKEDVKEKQPAFRVATGRKEGFWKQFWSKKDYDVLGIQKEEDQLQLDVQWRELLEFSVENVLAIVLTALFALAVLQLVWQLFVVVAGIIVSALKFTVLAAALVLLLILLL